MEGQVSVKATKHRSLREEQKDVERGAVCSGTGIEGRVERGKSILRRNAESRIRGKLERDALGVSQWGQE